MRTMFGGVLGGEQEREQVSRANGKVAEIALMFLLARGDGFTVVSNP